MNMIPRRYTFTLGIPLSLLIAVFLILPNCNKNGTDSQVSFHPGTYKGTYKVIQHWQSPDEVLKVDTMMFYFIAPDTFRMRLDTLLDQARRFCDASGKFFYGRDSLIINNVTINAAQLCDPGDKPLADFGYHIIAGDIVFKTSDTAIYREIVLWTR
jgi:hypothetical protein